MGAAFYVKRQSDSHEKDYVIVAGWTELQRLWIPITEEHELHLLRHAFDCGVTIDQELYEQALAETEVMLAEIQRREEPTDFDNGALARCRRFFDALRRYPPSAGWDIYLG